jgi:hypothetical protein
MPSANRGRFLPLHAFIAGLAVCYLFYFQRESCSSGIFYFLSDTRERNSAQRAAITADGFGLLFLTLNVSDVQLRAICFYDGATIILFANTLTSLSFGTPFFHSRRLNPRASIPMIIGIKGMFHNFLLFYFIKPVITRHYLPPSLVPGFIESDK